MEYVFLAIGVVIGYAIAYIVCTKKTTALTAEKQSLGRELELTKLHHAEEINSLKNSFDEQKRNSDEQFRQQKRNSDEQFRQQLDTTKEQLVNLSRQILEQNAERLKSQNAESIGNITQPLKDAIANMQKSINENNEKVAIQRTSFEEQIKRMVESNEKIGERAESLTNALRRDNKVQGNMGEIILGDLLASQGLTEGIHYEVQARLKDEMGRPLKNEDTGHEMQPDVILHYPQGQDAIIDSKVSLVAYEKYLNATTPEDKDRYLQDHIKSVRQHVNELARKDYSRYVKAPRKAIDFVIMFVPFESSLQLALANDPTLWHDAFERKVFISGEQNLMGILHIIHVAWVQNAQAENQAKVYDIAEELLNRMGDFFKRYEDLGEKIRKAQEAFDKADNKLMSGNQSVVKKVRELIDLGAKENPNRKIPTPKENWIEDSHNEK